jgi:NADH-quinone oxidoreductase subunit G
MQYDVKPSRFQEEKVHKDKMVDLGADIMLDEERCIVCTRCVRFCQEVAQKEELYVQARGNHSMVTTFPGKKMTNAYAGNTVDICPVGALTSKDFRYKKRVWLLSSAESICTGCARGCNINIDHADHRIYRLKPRFNADVNKYWMCDEGRYGYKFVNDKRRLKPALRRDGVLQEVSVADAIEHCHDLATSYKKGEIAFVASAEESHESIDAFIRMAREFFDASEVGFSKNDPQNPSCDDILIKADKNPNLTYVQKLGLKNISQISSHVKTLVVQRHLSDDDLKFVAEKKIKILALFSTNLVPEDEMAEVIFPLATFAEQAGHFTNFAGRVQSFSPAFAPRGESKEMREYFLIFKQSSRDGNFKS